MSTPDSELTPSSYLVTTTMDEDGNYGSETYDLTELPDELLFQYVAQGDQRAAAEMLARIEKVTGPISDESETEPESEPEEESP
jgi:hypothetical protein